MSESEANPDQAMTTVVIKIAGEQIYLSPDLLAVMAEYGGEPELTSPEVLTRAFLAEMFYKMKKENCPDRNGNTMTRTIGPTCSWTKHHLQTSFLNYLQSTLQEEIKEEGESVVDSNIGPVYQVDAEASGNS
ncbi:hypothetical protein CRENBAI_013561 [Crenichthys baileyi]|uniref:Uncharacterized protein n=1 Tax=Crenichthys baileyi TaxID=28760 RepID=A0AAV9RLR6_9TELE